jgi:hypothetical protein
MRIPTPLGARRPTTATIGRRPRTLLAAALLGGLTLGSLPGPVSARAAGPDHEMPFPCGDTWDGSSRPNHSPSALAIDWNRPQDLGAMVIASAAGVVTTAVNLGNRSYGRYVVVDHGRGRSSVYAHLDALWAVEGQAVDQGTPLGLVGSSGNSTGPHLHFEERLNGSDQHSYFHRRTFRMGTWQASRNCGSAPVVGDWDGNGTDDVGMQRRTTAPSYRLRRAGGTSVVIPFGWRSDQALSGDWNGDGSIEIGARRPGLRAFVLRRRDGSTRTVPLGRVADFGLTGDWNGDGRTDLGLWRPRTATFITRAASGSTSRLRFGTAGDRPVTGDWNGDGRTELGVFRSSTATFILRHVSRSGVVRVRSVALGRATSLPVTGDWDGDGRTDLGMWNPSTGIFSLRTTPGGTVTITRQAWGRPRG